MPSREKESATSPKNLPEKLGFGDLLFKDEWSYKNPQTGFHFRTGGIPETLLYVSFHGEVTSSEDILLGFEKSKQAATEAGLRTIPFILIDFSELKKSIPYRLKRLYAREAKKATLASDNSQARQIIIGSGTWIKAAVNLYTLVEKQEHRTFYYADTVTQAFDIVHDVLQRGPQTIKNTDPVEDGFHVTSADLEELHRAFATILWDNKDAVAHIAISPENPLGFLTDTIELLKKDVEEIRISEKKEHEHRLEESERNRKRLLSLMEDNEAAHLALKKNLEFQNIVSEISAIFVTTTIQNFEERISELLQKLALYFKIDRCCLHLISADIPKEKHVYEWSNQRFSSHTEQVRKDHKELAHWWHSELDSRKFVHFPDVHALSHVSKAQKEELLSQGIRSLCYLSVKSHNKMWGFLGLEALETQYSWNEHEIENLLTISNALANVLQKLESDQQVLQSANLLQAISEATAELLANSDVTQALRKSLLLVAESLQANQTYYFSMDDSPEGTTCSHQVACVTDGSPDIFQNPELQNIPMQSLGDAGRAIVQGEYYHTLVAALPKLSKARSFYEKQGIKSFIFIPVKLKNKVRGFIGFDYMHQEKVWGKEELNVLQSFADSISSALDRSALERELKISKQQAEAANKAKTEFLSNMSHEIRTPLNGVIGFTDLLKRTPLSTVQQQYVENANISGQVLRDVINDILDFSKIEAGMMQLEHVKTDLVALCEQSIDMVKYAADKKDLELLLHLDAQVPRFAYTDGLRLKQVLVNLLSNAVKFTNQGEIALEVNFEKLSKGKGTFTFRVRDTGIGIKEEQKEKLFKAFSQADTSITRKFGGTGLGLVISEMIVNHMGSTISFESEQDKGTAFWFHVRTQVEEAEIPEVYEGGIKRCLIIDDNDASRSVIRSILAKWKIDCEACSSGEEAIRTLEKSQAFDIILCDHHMPGMNGLETIRKIREHLSAKANSIPVLLMHAATGNNEIQKQCNELGVFFDLIKPVKSDELRTRLEKIKNQTVQSVTAKTMDRSALTIPIKKSVILVAEDVQMNFTLLERMLHLSMKEVTIIHVTNGKEAVAAYQKHQPDLIFMDIQMPEMDGISATKEIRKQEHESSKRVPIIALSAGAFKENEDRCLAAGMNEFLPKPLVFENLVAVLTTYLGQE